MREAMYLNIVVVRRKKQVSSDGMAATNLTRKKVQSASLSEASQDAKCLSIIRPSDPPRAIHAFVGEKSRDSDEEGGGHPLHQQQPHRDGTSLHTLVWQFRTSRRHFARVFKSRWPTTCPITVLPGRTPREIRKVNGYREHRGNSNHHPSGRHQAYYKDDVMNIRYMSTIPHLPSAKILRHGGLKFFVPGQREMTITCTLAS
jgi:hypothetical protein